MMSLAMDSPVNSSSSDDFASMLEAELGTGSSDASDHEVEEVEENEEEDDDDDDNGVEEKAVEEQVIEVIDDDGSNEVDDFEAGRAKRRKVGESKDNEASTSLAAMHQNLDVLANMETCSHPVSIREMCVICGKPMEDGSAVPLGYIHKDLKIGTEEMNRLRGTDLKNLLRNKKLYLVLDLDHTLLNSTRFNDIYPEEEYLKSQTSSLQDNPTGSLFKVDTIHMVTKLRPYVRSFLKEASSMYEMYVYTMGERPYALEMAKLLDPGRVFFDSKVISQSDCTQKHQKGLDVVLGSDSAVVILDDTEFVWSRHRENLILMERYHYFVSSCRQYNVTGKSLSESKRDEREADGALATVLKVLKRVHQNFFDPTVDDNSRDVRQVLKTIRREVLVGCKIVFSRLWKMEDPPENQKLWDMAVQLGATCCRELEPSVTHIVTKTPGTEKARWALTHGKFLVNPWWIEAANYLWERQPEEKFPVPERQ